MDMKEILTEYFGLIGEVDSPEWVASYERMTDCVYAICGLTGVSPEQIINTLDRIDTQNGEG